MTSAFLLVLIKPAIKLTLPMHPTAVTLFVHLW